VALAVELGQRNVACALIERNLTPQRIPKGQSLTNRTLEHFYFWHCLERLRGARIMPPDYPIGGLSAYGSLSSEYWRVAGDFAERGPHYYQKNERLPQYLTEGVLRERVAQLPSVTTMFGSTARSFEQDADGVRVVVVGEGNEERELTADYAVGCDGGRSMVRETLGIGRHGTDFGMKMVLAVFSSPQLHEGLKRFPERTTYSVVHPDLGGTRYFLGRVEVGESWFFHCAVPNDANPENYDFHALIERAAGFALPDLKFEHIGFFDCRIAVADEYGKGRVFIAGDAAHTHPPYGGFGLNSGLEDVTNLGWKLAARLQGWGGETLLESYGEEREPVFTQTGEFQIAAGIRRAAEFAQRYNPAVNKEEFEEAWAKFGAPGGDGPVRAYDPHYSGSAVVSGEAGEATGIYGGRHMDAVAGHHLPPQPLSNGKNVFEALGAGFTLLALDADPASVNAIEAAASAAKVPLTIVQDSYDAERKAYASRLVLVRPDQHIAWAGDKAPSDAAALIRRVTGS
jgi:2-polyprenyl-6-methoxyphenol hydroxylase-like FAD-dependent oxidoreductase